MAAPDTEVLRQFLVSLGFRVDEIQQRKFDTTVKKADETALRLGKTLLTVGAAAQAMVVGFANSFEKLYYLSQRTGTSASDIKAAGAAGKQIGLNAEVIESTIANISRTMKSDPGVVALIEGLTGKSTAGRGVDKVMQDVVRSLGKFPDFVAFDFAQRVGIDADTYLQLKNNLDEYVAAQEKNVKLQQEMGVNIDKNAEALKRYKQELSDLGTKVELVGLKIAEKLLPSFLQLAMAAGETVSNISKLIDLLDKGDVGNVGKSPAPKARPKNWFDSVLPESWVSFLTTGDSSVPVEGNTTAAQRRASGRVQTDPGASKPGTRGARNNNPGNIEYGPFARSMGAIGTDGRFAVFPDMQTGTQALAALMGSYQRRGFNTIDKIVGRYAPAHENNTGAYGNFLAGQLGVGRDQTLGSEHMNKLVGGISLYESRFNPLENGVVINQTNTTTIQGNSDPALAGRAVTDAQQRANSDITRNLKGVVR